MLGYSVIAYIRLSFAQIPDNSISFLVIRQRTALSALAMAVSISSIVMGFAVFMIGAKGEINFKAESAFVKGALSGVPGPFFVLCGTVVAVTVLVTRVSYEQGAPVVPPNAATSSAAAPATVVASRTIASSPNQRIALFTADVTVYNQLLGLAREETAEDALSGARYLIANQEKLAVVMVSWNDANNRPDNFVGTGVHDQNRQQILSGGYLFVLAANNAETLKAVLSAAEAVAGSFPEADHLPEDRIVKLLKDALKDRKVFVRGEPS
jgi:zinc transporter ZupT